VPQVVEEVLARLDEVLPLHASWLAESLRPPVTETDLEALRSAVAPYDLPPEVVTMLRWHDGQAEEAWWPSFLGYLPFDRAEWLARHHTARRSLYLDDVDDSNPFPPNLLPLTWHSWSLYCLELSNDVTRGVVDATLDSDLSIVLPSLAALLEATADLAEAGLITNHVDIDAWPNFYKRAVPIVQATCERHSAGSWAFAGWTRGDSWPTLSRSGDAWPSHWTRDAISP
jgi:hypothetical protein